MKQWVLFASALFLLFGSVVPAEARQRPYFPSIGSVQGATAVRVPVILYHYIRPLPENDPLGVELTVPPEQFKKQLSYLLQQGYAPISPAQLYGALSSTDVLPEKPVLLTFDDGTSDFYSTVFPIIQSLGIPATVYVVPGFIGTSGYLTFNQLKQLAESPLITIGGHGLNHVPLAKLDRQIARRQIVITKNFLEMATGKLIDTFAYPNGSYDPTIAKFVLDAGYHTAFTTNLGSTQTYETRAQLPRVRAGSSIQSLKLALEK